MMGIFLIIFAESACLCLGVAPMVLGTTWYSKLIPGLLHVKQHTGPQSYLWLYFHPFLLFCYRQGCLLSNRPLRP